MTAYITEGRQLAAETADAYSFDRYGETEWRKTATSLLARDWTRAEVEWVLRSKFMRWAADMSSSDAPTAKDVLAFIDEPRNRASRADVQKHIADEG